MITSIRDEERGKKRILLREWEEIQGIFRGLVEEKNLVFIQFDDSQLVFSSEALDGEIAKNKLNGRLIGNRISILRTDISEKPIIIRVDKIGKRY
jgi:hypothetical protein